MAAEYNHDERYIPGVEMLFVSFGILGSLVGLALNVVDYKNGSVLNRTHRRPATATVLSLDHDDMALDHAHEALLSAEH